MLHSRRSRPGKMRRSTLASVDPGSCARRYRSMRSSWFGGLSWMFSLTVVMSAGCNAVLGLDDLEIASPTLEGGQASAAADCTENRDCNSDAGADGNGAAI